MHFGIFQSLSRLFTLVILLWSLATVAFLSLAVFFGVIFWYGFQEGNRPVSWGFSWSEKKADDLGIASDLGLTATLSEIPFKRVQLMSYWDLAEIAPSEYDFSRLANHFEIAKSYRAKVSLQLGLHQSYAPYCHLPAHVGDFKASEFKQALKSYIRAVVENFDQETHLVEYQLEPEIGRFEATDCGHFLSSEDLKEIYDFLRPLTSKKIVLSQTHNYLSWLSRPESPDGLGLRIDPYADDRGAFWQKYVSQATLPGSYYNFLAGWLKIKNSHSHILIRQLETETEDLKTEISEKTAKRLEKQLLYGRQTSVPIIDIQGAEWWLYQKEQKNQPGLWQMALKIVSEDF